MNDFSYEFEIKAVGSTETMTVHGNSDPELQYAARALAVALKIVEDLGAMNIEKMSHEDLQDLHERAREWSSTYGRNAPKEMED